MLIWVCALHCEAKPVIDFYRLRKQPDLAFDLYLGDAMACVVSGVGKIASAAATGWMGARYESTPALAWINLGTAGAAAARRGDAFQLEQVEDGETGLRLYPVILDRGDLPGASCRTLSRPDEVYDETRLSDMEASAYLYAALRFSSAELTQSFKVISDNRDGSTGKQRAAVSALIADHMPVFAAQADRLLQLAAEIGGLAVESEYWRQLIKSRHFTRTEQSQLRQLLRYLLLRDSDPARIDRAITGQPSGGAIIKTLENLRQQDAEVL